MCFCELVDILNDDDFHPNKKKSNMNSNLQCGVFTFIGMSFCDNLFLLIFEKVRPVC